MKNFMKLNFKWFSSVFFRGKFHKFNDTVRLQLIIVAAIKSVAVFARSSPVYSLQSNNAYKCVCISVEIKNFIIVIIIISCVVSRNKRGKQFSMRKTSNVHAQEEEKHNWILHICVWKEWVRERETEHVKFNWIFCCYCCCLPPSEK